MSVNFVSPPQLSFCSCAVADTMVDRTGYLDEARTPKIALRQIFARHALSEDLRLAAANNGLLSVEVFAIGDSASAAKEAIKAAS